MTTNLSKFLKQIHHLLAPPGGEQTDGELLARFVATRDEASFAALVRRHGPMVLAVCRRMLRHEQDAEDCFQATFLVMARKAAAVKREAVGSFLYAVAYRTSLEARAISARRRKREKQVRDMPHPPVLPPEPQDWRPWLDQELSRLPERFRSVIVACDMEGRSRKDAARQLGIAEGTLSSRLARGRRLLAQRLAPYGLSLSGAALGAALCETAASAQVPAALVSSTTKAALLIAAGELAAVSAASAILMKGVLKSMLLTKLKMMIGAVMIVTALGASGLVYRAAAQSAGPVEKPGEGKPKSEVERLRHENELLKLNLEVVLEKVRAQEAELRTLKGKPQTKDVSINAAFSPEGKTMAIERIGVVDLNAHAIDEGSPLRIFINEINQPRNKEQLQRAIDEMEKALKGLRGQLKHKAAPNKEKEKQGSLRDQSQLENAEKRLKELAEKLQELQSDSSMWQERAVWSDRMARRQYITIEQAAADQAHSRNAIIAEAETALKLLREARNADTQRKAADALDKALKKLNEHLKQPGRGK